MSWPDRAIAVDDCSRSTPIMSLRLWILIFHSINILNPHAGNEEPTGA